MQQPTVIIATCTCLHVIHLQDGRGHCDQCGHTIVVTVTVEKDPVVPAHTGSAAAPVNGDHAAGEVAQ